MKTTCLYLTSYAFGIILAACSVLAADPPFVLLHSLLDPSTNAQSGAEQGDTVSIDGNFAVVGAPTDDDSGTVKIYDATTGAVLHTLINPEPSSTKFGRSVSISGTRIVVGAPEIGDDSGGVYIYDLASAAPTIPVLTIINPFPEEDARFGLSVSISGTRVVVGQVGGFVLVFDLSSATPERPVATLEDPRHLTSSSFGAAVAISGGRVVVGAYDDDRGGVDAGWAYVFDLSSATPATPIASINNPVPQAHDAFGFSVAISGTRAVIGAPGISFPPSAGGKAYVYDLASDAPSIPAATLGYAGSTAGDSFGWAVAISGVRAVVGAPSVFSGNTDAGKSCVYDLTGANPASPVAVVHYPGATPYATFGYSVAISDARLLVGAPGDSARADYAGSAYLYDMNSATPTAPVAALNDPNPSTNDRFGSAVALSGTRLVVGYQSFSRVVPQVDVYDLRSAIPTPFVLPSPVPAFLTAFGWAVAISGRWVVVGSPYSLGTRSPGVVYVYDLNGAAPTIPALTLNKPNPAVDDSFGWSVAISGTRLIVGAPGDATGGLSSGSAYIYDLASSTPTIPVATLNYPGSTARARFGNSVAISGTRVVVGTPNANSAYAYELAAVDPTTPIATLNNPNPGISSSSFGASVAISGPRIVVAAPDDIYGGTTYVYDVGSGTPTVPIVTLMNPTWGPQEYFGSSVAISGTRVLVGAQSDSPGTNYYSGSAYVFDLAAGAPFAPLATLTSPTPAPFDGFGTRVAMDEDIVVAGAPYVDINGLNRGAVYVFIANQPTVDALIRMVESANLGRSERPLLATLNAADASFDRGSVGSGINQLEAFQNKVRAQIAPHDPATAEILINAAQDIISGFEQTNDTPHDHGNAKSKARGHHKQWRTR